MTSATRLPREHCAVSVGLAVVMGLMLVGVQPLAAQTPVGSEFRANTTTYATQYDPQVAYDGLGNFVVVWMSRIQDGDGYGIYGQRYDGLGQPLGSEFLVNTTTTFNQIEPAVACGPTGAFVVAWESDGDIYAQRFDSAGNRVGTEFLVNTPSPQVQQTPDVSMAWDGTGGFVITWTSYQNGVNFDIYAQQYDGDGAPLGSAFRANTTAAMDQTGSSVSHDALGNFVIVWTSAAQDGEAGGIYGQRYSSTGAPQDVEFRVNTTTAGDQIYPCVDHDGAGRFAVVWMSFGQDGERWGVFGQQYDSGGNALGSEFQVNTITAGSQLNPAVAFDPWGKFVVTWGSSPDAEVDASMDTYGRVFDEDGLPLGAEFQVNTYTDNGQRPDSRSRHVAFAPNGDLVIVWQSLNQDGSGWGIYGQRHAQTISITGTVTSDCGGPMGGVTVELVALGAEPLSTLTGEDGTYAFTELAASTTYDVTVVLPEDYVAVEPATGTVHFENLSTDAVADFALGCLYDVAGAVSSDCQAPMAGVTVGLMVGDDYQTVLTAADGSYRFEDLRYLSEIELTCVLPLGFHAVSPADGHVSLTLMQDAVVDFALGCVDASGAARGMGYWKHQATVYVKGKGHAQESEADMRTHFPNAIFEHFHDHELYGIPVEGVTYMGDPHAPLDLATIHATLTVNGGPYLLARAKQHYMALMLNLASGKILTFTVVSEDGRTASEVVQYVADLINDGDAGNDELAKDICEMLNEARLLDANVVPEGYVTVYYRRPLGWEQPLSFSPNPVGLGSVVSFGMPVAGRAELVVFDVAGRKVASLLSGEVEAGTVRLQWLGRTDTGERLPKGIYTARLVTPQGVKTTRVVHLGL